MSPGPCRLVAWLSRRPACSRSLTKFGASLFRSPYLLVTGGALALLGEAYGVSAVPLASRCRPGSRRTCRSFKDRVQLQQEMLNLIVNAAQANVRSERVARVADRLCARCVCYATMCHAARLACGTCLPDFHPLAGNYFEIFFLGTSGPLALST
jgi:hypothetical protein